MSVDERSAQAPARRQAPPTYFVGRREFEAAEIYAVTTTDVTRLQSARRYDQAVLDWHGSSDAGLELSHLLISHVAEQRSSPELDGRFAQYVLRRLPDDGFVLDADAIWRWLRMASDQNDFLPDESWLPAWASRLRRLCPAVLVPSLRI